MDVTDIGNKEEGKVWHRKPTAGKSVLATVVRTAPQAKTVRFLHVAFDTTGDSFLAGDHHGNIYVFDITRNRFRLVQRTGQACTAVAFTLRRTTEFLVALADYTIKCFDKDTKQLVSWMRGHEGAVSSISVHSSGRYAITTSSDTAQLWDLDTFQRKRKLNIKQSFFRCFSCLLATPSSAVSAMTPSSRGKATHFSANTSFQFPTVDQESLIKPLLSHVTVKAWRQAVAPTCCTFGVWTASS